MGNRQPKRSYRKLNINEVLSVEFTDAPLGYIAVILQERANFTINVPADQIHKQCSYNAKDKPFADILAELNLVP